MVLEIQELVTGWIPTAPKSGYFIFLRARILLPDWMSI